MQCTCNVYMYTYVQVHVCVHVLHANYLHVIVAVFSDEYTAGSGKSRKKHGSSHDDEVTTPIKLPYFMIAKRSIEEKLVE